MYQCYRCGKQGMDLQEASGHTMFDPNCAKLAAMEMAELTYDDDDDDDDDSDDDE